MYKKIAITVVLLGLIIVGFQNCAAQLSFRENTDNQNNVQTTSGGNPTITSTSCTSPQVQLSGTCVCPGGANMTATGCVSCNANQVWNSATQTCDTKCSAGTNWNGSTCVTCAAGQTWDGQSCVTQSSGCTTLVRLRSPFVIPARSAVADCFYVKLIDAVVNQSSEDFPVERTDVVSVNQDAQTPSPRIVGSSSTSPGATTTVDYMVQGTRDALLAGADQLGVAFEVDNFLLMEFFQNGSIIGLWAAGSVDSIPSSGQVTVNGVPVDFSPGAATGANNFFTPPNVNKYIPLNQELTTRATALDDGYQGTTSDVYMIFR